MLFYRNYILKFLFTLVLGSGIFTYGQAKQFSLVLDPGHGGKDYGAIGNATNEKTINLAVAKMIAELISEDYDDVNIIMTRKDDKYLSLKERADIANNAKGDLFVSIHVNSADKKNKNRKNLKGTSVYTLGLHKSAANFEVAKRENAVISLDPDFETSYEGFDPNSTESYIIFELSQNKHMGQSINIAQQIQNELIATAERADRGVRQAGFWVLWATGMPSVLVELDFICNPEQEKFMASSKGQKKMAEAIANAICSYIDTHNGTAPVQITDNTASVNETGIHETSSESVRVTTIPTYHIQILAASSPIKSNSNELKGQKAKMFKEGSWYKYYVGECETMEEAKKLLSSIKKDFPKAFIIKMKEGHRVTE